MISVCRDVEFEPVQRVLTALAGHDHAASSNAGMACGLRRRHTQGGLAMLVQENLQHDHICSKRCGGMARLVLVYEAAGRRSLRLVLAG